MKTKNIIVLTVSISAIMILIIKGIPIIICFIIAGSLGIILGFLGIVKIEDFETKK